MAHARGQTSERRTVLFVAGLTLLACACRVPLLFHGLWRDEGSTFFDVTAPTLDRMLHEISTSELTPPAFFLLMRGWVVAFGTSELVLKLPAWLFGTALVPATYALGRLFGPRRAATLAAGFAAFSLTGITLSTEARAYTLCALLGALAAGFALRYLSSQAEPKLLLAYVAVATGVVYVHYSGVVLIGSLALGALTFAVRRSAWRALALFEAGNAVVGCAILPWLPHAAGARHAAFLERDGATSFAGRFVEQFGFVLPVEFMHVLYAALLLVALGAALVHYARREPGAEGAEQTRVIAASLTLLAGTCVETVLSLHEQRYMFVFTPLAHVLVATFCTRLIASGCAVPRAWTMASAARAALAWALGASLVAGLPTQARAIARSYGADRSGIRRLVAENSRSLDRRTLVVVAPDYLAPTIGYYLRERPDVVVAGVPQWTAPAHPQCCGSGWRDARMVATYSRRIVASVARDYSAVAYVWDLRAYDEGPVPYSKIFQIRDCLARSLQVVAERRYDGTKERVGMTIFRSRR